MWASKASTWNATAVRSGSMKWHLVDEASLEVRVIDVGWGVHKRAVNRTYGFLDCGRKGRNHFDSKHKLPLVFKEAINISQANICAYCKKARMKELGIGEMKV